MRKYTTGYVVKLRMDVGSDRYFNGNSDTPLWPYVAERSGAARYRTAKEALAAIQPRIDRGLVGRDYLVIVRLFVRR